MGIHVHVKGQPDMCGCCALVDRLNELWNRTHNSVLSVNGVYADGNGAIVIPGIQDISDLRQQVADDRQYLEAVAEDLVTNYATKSALQSLSASASATQTQLTNLANELNNVHPYVTTNTEQIITGKKTFTQALKVSGGSYSAQYGVNAGNGDAVISKGTTAVISASENGCFIYSPTDVQSTRATTIGWVQNTDGISNIVHNNQINDFKVPQRFFVDSTRCGAITPIALPDNHRIALDAVNGTYEGRFEIRMHNNGLATLVFRRFTNGQLSGEIEIGRIS